MKFFWTDFWTGHSIWYETDGETNRVLKIERGRGNKCLNIYHKIRITFHNILDDDDYVMLHIAPLEVDLVHWIT